MMYVRGNYHPQSCEALIHAKSDDRQKSAVGDLISESIPHRYRDGKDSINFEQLRRDRIRARRKVVQEMLGSLRKLWRS